MHDLISLKCMDCTELFICNINLQLMFTQSVTDSGSGFPLLATYIAEVKAAWRELTVSLNPKTNRQRFYFISGHININQTWTHAELLTSRDHTQSDSLGWWAANILMLNSLQTKLVSSHKWHRVHHSLSVRSENVTVFKSNCFWLKHS